MNPERCLCLFELVGLKYVTIGRRATLFDQMTQDVVWSPEGPHIAATGLDLNPGLALLEAACMQDAACKVKKKKKR